MGTLGRDGRPGSCCTPRCASKNGVRGVIVPEEKAEFGKLKLDACYVDIGAKDRGAGPQDGPGGGRRGL